MSQFRKADSSVYTVFLDLIEKVFPELSGYSFGLLYREKIQKSRGGVVLASICQPTKLLSYFAKNDAGKPFDFLMVVDEMGWVCAKEPDRIRIIRHELRHIRLSEKGVPKLVDHDFQDFYKEVDLNADDPSWCQKLVEITLAGYDQAKDGMKDPRNDHRANEGVTQVTKDPERQTKLAPNKKNDELSQESKDVIMKAAVKSSKAMKPKVSKVYIGRDKDNKEVWEDATYKMVKSAAKNIDELAKEKGLLGANV